MNPPPDPELELLRSGLESYLPAMNAIVAFRERIQDACRTAFSTVLPELIAAFGVPLTKSTIEPFTSPSGKRISDWSCVGVGVKLYDPCEVWIGLNVGWIANYTTGYSVQASCEAEASFNEAAKAKIDSHAADWYEYDEGFLIQTFHEAAEASQLVEQLVAIQRSWAQLWKPTGGLKKLVARKAK